MCLALVVPMVVGVGRKLSLSTPSGAAVGQASAGASGAAGSEQVADAYGDLPLSFIRNAGHADPQVRYAAQGPGFGVSFTSKEAFLSFVKGKRGHTLALRFLGANPETSVTARQQLPGSVNYLIGDPAEWRTRLPTYQQVVYRDLWPGVDAVFAGEEGKLKYEFHLAPGARVSDLRLVYSGAEDLAMGPGGELLIHTSLGTLRDAAPISYQSIRGRRVGVESRYVVAPDGTYGFALGPGYDPGLPLVIDPELAYSTFIGGTDEDWGADIAVDTTGHAYVTGLTRSPDFPTTPGAFDTTFNGPLADAFVIKLSRDGSALVYSTFLGGASFEWGTSIAVGPAGHAHVTGFTFSPDFPITPGAYDTTYNGRDDGFVTKLSPDGSALVYSTFLGGAQRDQPIGIGLAREAHSESNAYVIGETASPDFPTTPGAFDTRFDGAQDAFVTKLSRDGSALVYSTFLGGKSSDWGQEVAVGPAGHAHVIGFTDSPDFPTTPGAFDTTHNGSIDAVVAKLTTDGSGLMYSTFLGGSFLDLGNGISVGLAGHAYVTGRTDSPNFPTTPGASDPTYNGNGDAFVAKFGPDGSALVYSTFLGGADTDEGGGVAIDPTGHAYVTGPTLSLDFPTSWGAFDTSYNGERDAFVTKLSDDGSALSYSTFLGGAFFDEGVAIAVHSAAHSARHVYVTGRTDSPDFPTTPGAVDPTYNSNGDAFVSKFVIGDKRAR